MATEIHPHTGWLAPAGHVFAPAAFATGAVTLAGEGVVHVQQYGEIFHSVRWVGPLFILNAVACAVVIAGLAYRRTRELASVAGILVSVLALGSLVISYGQGLFGWQEAGFRTATALAVIFEVAAVAFLSAGLAARAMRRER